MKNPLANLFSLFSRAPSQSVVGIDFGSSAVKVVQIKKRAGQAVLETYGAVALGPYAEVEAGRAARTTPAKLSEALSDVLREAKVTARRCGAAISMSASLVAAFSVPHREGQDLRGIIPIEARKYIPTPLSEVELNWRVLPRPSAGATSVSPDAPVDKTEALVTAIHRDALSRLQGVCAQAALEPSFFEVEVFATTRAAALAPDKAFGIIDIGAGETKIIIVDEGLLRDAHTVNRGGQDMTLALASSLGIPFAEAEVRKRRSGAENGAAQSSVIARIFGEAREVFSRYEARARRAFSGLVLSGGGALSSGLLEEVGKVFSLPVTLIDPNALLSAPAFLAPMLSRVGPEFAVAIGAALRRLEETH